MPYAERLAQKYGGIFLHSCGNPLACVDVLRNYHNFMGLDFWEVTVEQFHSRGGDYACSCTVFEDPWHNLDRREARITSEQAAEDSIRDIKSIYKHLTTPLMVSAICPHPNYASQYYEIISAVSHLEDKTHE